jgi:hypothetical protein
VQIFFTDIPWLVKNSTLSVMVAVVGALVLFAGALVIGPIQEANAQVTPNIKQDTSDNCIEDAKCTSESIIIFP